MTLTSFQKIVLGLSGTTAFGIGTFILVAPQVFYASYGISIDGNVNLLSELRAPATGLAAFGILMLAGIVRSALDHVSAIAALTVFLAFPAGRLAGLIIDGLPSVSIIGALAIELTIGALCLTAFGPQLWRILSDIGSSRANAL